MNRSVLRRIAILVVVAALSACDSPASNSARIYEALFDQVDLLGMDRTYYILTTEQRPRFRVETPFRFPDEIGTHTAEALGAIQVSFIDEAYYTSLWEAGCRDGWARFHQENPDAGDLVEMSQIALNENADQAAIYIRVGRGCQHAWSGTYYLELQDDQWVVTRLMNPGQA